MSNSLWLLEDQKFLDTIKYLKIPDLSLKDVSFFIPKKKEDFDSIPTEGGCYWIWTNEPVLHFLHKNPTPKPFNGGEIIYNGITQINLRERVKHHLMGHIDAGWSGISLDMHFGDTVSHKKKALSIAGKVPFIKIKKVINRANKKKELFKVDEIEIYKSIRTKNELMKIFLSESETKKLDSLNNQTIFFRNGINIFDTKHEIFDFRVYYITGISLFYLEFIEKKWREIYGLPKLCSYSAGR
jgi:hypothetical protein